MDIEMLGFELPISNLSQLASFYTTNKTCIKIMHWELILNKVFLSNKTPKTKNASKNCEEYFWNGSHAIPMQRPFLPKLSHHRNVSLALYLPILYFLFCQKTNLHLYKPSRLRRHCLLYSYNLVSKYLATTCKENSKTE